MALIGPNFSWSVIANGLQSTYFGKCRFQAAALAYLPASLLNYTDMEPEAALAAWTGAWRLDARRAWLR